MSLITVVRDVCAVVGVAAPTSVFAGIDTNRTMFEMLANANEMAQRIAYDTRDWTTLRVEAVLTGDGHWVPPQPDPTAIWTGTSGFDLPANYKRMLLTSSVWRSTSTQQPMLFVSDTDEWMQRRTASHEDGWGEWTIYGGYIHVWPIMAGFIPAVIEDPGPPFIPARPAVPAVTARFAYLDKNCIALASGGVGDRFMSDDDTFRLDERILKLGMIANWKEQKGSPYAEALGVYSDAIANTMGHDKPSPIIIGRGTRGRQYADHFWH